MKELHWAIYWQEGLSRLQGEEGSDRLRGRWLLHHMPLKPCINFFLALGDGVRRMTASPVFNRSAICHDHAGCAHDSSEAFSAQPLWAKVRCAVAIVNEYIPKFPTEVDIYRQPKKYVRVPFLFYYAVTLKQCVLKTTKNGYVTGVFLDVLWRYCMDWRWETGQEFIDFLRVSDTVSMIFLQNLFFSGIWQT